MYQYAHMANFRLIDAKNSLDDQGNTHTTIIKYHQYIWGLTSAYRLGQFINIILIYSKKYLQSWFVQSFLVMYVKSRPTKIRKHCYVEIVCFYADKRKLIMLTIIIVQIVIIRSKLCTVGMNVCQILHKIVRLNYTLR